MAGVWWNVLLLAASLIALPLDRRVILGLNPWIKPLKFEISVIVFLLTAGLLLAVLRQDGRWTELLRWCGWGFGVAMIVENTLIAMQSARGVPSHMNFSSHFNAATFATMGLFILLNTLLLAIVFWLFCVARLAIPPSELWGIRLGLVLLLAGSLEGALIVNHGGHTVGAPDGGAGLPFLNWSLQHGDLRVAHFFALHALQILWLAGWALGRTRLPSLPSVVAVVLIGVGYAGGVWFLFVQAKAGRPVVPVEAGSGAVPAAVAVGDGGK
jgi:hypothetical protein